jgi:hypothetical protein
MNRESAPIESGTEGQENDARSRAETKAELMADLTSLTEQIQDAVGQAEGRAGKSAEAEAWLTERYGGLHQAKLELLRTQLELATILMQENSDQLAQTQGPEKRARLQEKQVALTVERAEILEALQKEKAELEAERAAKDREAVERIRRSLPKRG